MKNFKIEELIKIGEGETLEFKSSFNIQVIETLVAFANTKGGEIYIGISDKKQVDSLFVANQETIPNWLNEIKTKTHPSLVPDIEIIEVGGNQIIEISIKEFPIKPVACKGKYFKRVKNSNHQLSLAEISLMHLKTFNSSWDYYPANNYSIEDISEEKIRTFIKKVNSAKDYKIEDDIFVVLRKYELLKQNDQITNACHLLFAKNAVYSATIELGRFSDPASIKDGYMVKSDLFSQVGEVIAFIKKHINKEFIITEEPQREERWQYPITAIREIMINMIVHRDYSNYGASSIKIFNDRIEFYNPGKLPENITTEKILSGDYVSEIRNLQIATLFKEAKLIEKYGSGFTRIIKAFKEYNLAIPIFENFQSGFRIIVYAKNENIVDNVTDNVTENVTENRLSIIIKMIKKDNTITTERIAEKLNLTKRTILRDVEKLKKQNRLVRVGSEKSGHWEVV